MARKVKDILVLMLQVLHYLSTLYLTLLRSVAFSFCRVPNMLPSCVDKTIIIKHVSLVSTFSDFHLLAVINAKTNISANS